MDTEGSVMVDGQTPEVQEENQEHIENSKESSSEQKDSTVEVAEEAKTEPETKTEEQSEDKEEGAEDGAKQVEKTDKGTKLAEDPLQRANQLRANAEAKARQMEMLLNDPVRLKAYVEEFEKENKKVEPEEELIDPNKIETTEDLQKFAKQLMVKSQKEIEAVKRELGGYSERERTKAVVGKITSEIQSVQTKYPALREFNADGSRNPEYNEELDKAVGEFYNKLDLDEKTGRYRGNYSIMEIADRMMGVRNLGEKTGAVKAQTIVKDKRTGRVITNQQGDSETSFDESKQSAATTIAERMKRAALRTRK